MSERKIAPSEKLTKAIEELVGAAEQDGSGLLRELASLGEDVQIWTVCAGEIPTGDLSPFAELLHQRWGSGREAVARRKEEDRLACERLGARRRLFPLPDCIYRRAGDGFWGDPQAGRAPGARSGEHLYITEQAIFGPVHPAESGLVARLSQELASGLPDRSELIVPLALGGHVDHRLARAAAETLARASSGRRTSDHARGCD